MVLLRVCTLSKFFGGVTAIKNLDFEVKKNEILGLIGPNGCGKTTLFNLITGFHKSDRGAIFLEGKDITHVKPYMACQKGIARTFQIVRPFSELTTLENVAIGTLYGSDPIRSLNQGRKEAQKILNFIGFADKTKVIARNLGLVDRKTLELGRALATKPKLLLLDEIMAGLNPVEIETTMRLVHAIRESGITVIVVEHLMKAVLGMSDRIIVLNAGEKIAEGTPKQISVDPQVIQAYLGRTLHANG